MQKRILFWLKKRYNKGENNNDLSKSNTDNYIPILDFIIRQQFFIFEKDEKGKLVKKAIDSVRVGLEMER